MKVNVKYMCVGENFRDGVQIGDLAKTKTLMEWLEYLFPTTSKEDLIEFFKLDIGSIRRWKNERDIIPRKAD